MAMTKAILATVVLVGVLAGCATVAVQGRRVVTGQVTDESGAPVAGTPVLVVARSLTLAPLRLEYDERGRREVRTVTDAQGRFRIEFSPAQLGNNFFLFFYDATGFDRVKYRRSEPVDITERLGRDQTVTVDRVLQFDPSWAEVARQVAYFGAESDRSQILRQHGLPDKREAPAGAGAEAEVWWYYLDGVSYSFVGQRLTRTSQFPPMPRPAPQQ
jgi:hypothetical protein